MFLYRRTSSCTTRSCLKRLWLSGSLNCYVTWTIGDCLIQSTSEVSFFCFVFIPEDVVCLPLARGTRLNTSCRRLNIQSCSQSLLKKETNVHIVFMHGEMYLSKIPAFSGYTPHCHYQCKLLFTLSDISIPFTQFI